jgi:hypothetical protein
MVLYLLINLLMSRHLIMTWLATEVSLAVIDENSDAFCSSAYLKFFVPIRADLSCRVMSLRIGTPLNTGVQTKIQ